MRRLLLGLGCAAAIAVGCGSSVVDPGQTGTGGGATAGIGGATTTTPGGGGAGGEIAFTTGTGGVGGDVLSTTGAGGGPLCADGTVFVDIAGDVTQHIDASCAPQGALVFGSAGPQAPGKTPPDPGPSGVAIMACSQGPGVVLSLFGHGHMWPGTSMVVDVGYQYNGEEYQNTPLLAGLLEVDTVGPIDGAIEGSFSATVAPQGGTPQLAIHGTFRVCRTYDEHLA